MKNKPQCVPNVRERFIDNVSKVKKSPNQNVLDVWDFELVRPWKRPSRPRLMKIIPIKRLRDIEPWDFCVNFDILCEMAFGLVWRKFVFSSNCNWLIRRNLISWFFSNFAKLQKKGRKVVSRFFFQIIQFHENFRFLDFL